MNKRAAKIEALHYCALTLREKADMLAAVTKQNGTRDNERFVRAFYEVAEELERRSSRKRGMP